MTTLEELNTILERIVKHQHTDYQNDSCKSSNLIPTGFQWIRWNACSSPNSRLNLLGQPFFSVAFEVEDKEVRHREKYLTIDDNILLKSKIYP